MLNKEELKCIIEEILVDYGYKRLESIIYGIDSPIDNFEIIKIKTFNRMLNPHYKFCNLNVSEEDALELINTYING